MTFGSVTVNTYILESLEFTVTGVCAIDVTKLCSRSDDAHIYITIQYFVVNLCSTNSTQFLWSVILKKRL